MRKSLNRLCILALCVLFFAVACGKNTNKKPAASSYKKWDCTITCADSNPTTVTYSNKELVAASNAYTVQNNNAFDVKLFVTKQDRKENEKENSNDSFAVPIKAYQSYAWNNVENGHHYQIGCGAKVKEGTKIHIRFTAK